ncbi:D-alanyl-D-alanine carboxypeptidase, partial [bacterium]|nr:D-alanyl-D-alanine carboxypeptidase [bacterium]
MLLRWVCCLVVGCFFSFSDARLIDSTVQQLAKTLKMPLYNGTDVAVIVRDLSSNTVLYEHNVARSFVPASLMKLVLTGAWLDNVRPSYQFKTPVYVDRQSPPSLYIKGVGDPNHRLDQFESLANRLKQLGITSLDEVILDTGNVIADHNKMKDYAQYYYALAAGLNFNFN